MLAEREGVYSNKTGHVLRAPHDVDNLEAFNGYFNKDKEEVNADLKALGELSLKILRLSQSSTRP